jgi:hypothetical protein
MSITQSYQLADVHISAARGAKSAMLTCKTGQVVWLASQACEAPFGATNFDRDVTAVRQNLELRLSKEQDDFFSQVDAWAVEYLSANSERLFKKQLTVAQVKEIYHSPVKSSEKYDPLLRTKITSSGNWATRYWDHEGKPAAAPASLKGVRLIPRLHLSHLWIMGSSCGFAVNVTDIQVEDVPLVECPFAQ